MVLQSQLWKINQEEAKSIAFGVYYLQNFLLARDIKNGRNHSRNRRFRATKLTRIDFSEAMVSGDNLFPSRLRYSSLYLLFPNFVSFFPIFFFFCILCSTVLVLVRGRVRFCDDGCCEVVVNSVATVVVRWLSIPWRWLLRGD